MSIPYSVSEFVQRVKDIDYPEVIRLTELEVENIERVSYRARGSVRRRQLGSTRYAENLKGLLWLLRSGTRPAGVDDGIFQSFRPIIESLVQRGQLRPTALKVFEQ
jgi:hypothetical protein